jgi:hypothetical protein
MVTVDIERRLDGHDRRLDAHGAEIRDIQLWKAQVKGFLLALTIFASLPSVVMAWLALSGGFAK